MRSTKSESAVVPLLPTKIEDVCTLTRAAAVDHVRAKLAKVAVELAREANGARDARKAGAHQMVEVTVRRGRQLQSAEANVIKCLPQSSVAICFESEYVLRCRERQPDTNAS